MVELPQDGFDSANTAIPILFLPDTVMLPTGEFLTIRWAGIISELFKFETGLFSDRSL